MGNLSIDNKWLIYLFGEAIPKQVQKVHETEAHGLKSYVLGRLYKDFATLTTTRGDYIERIDSLSRLLAGMSGNLIKYANIANSVGFDDKTVKKYMQDS